MVTIYDVLEVEENASKEEIEKAYTKLVYEYRIDPNLSEEDNKENELLLNKLKIAYGILSNDEKRKKYDQDLAQKRAEELIKNVAVSSTEEKIEVKEEVKQEVKQEVVKPQVYTSVPKDEIVETNETHELYEEEDVVLTKEEQNKLRKAAQKEFKTNLKRAQKAEEEYNQAYNEAYNNYLRKLGYQVKEPWTWKRVKNTIIGILSIVIACMIIWFIPATRQLLINFYNENYIVKALVDVVIALVKAVLSIFQ
jgi:curved DNA-binding protein CbpA